MRQLSLTLMFGVVAFAATYWFVRQSASPSSVPAVSVAEEVPKAGASEAGMVWIPAGPFLMGTNEKDVWPDERPAHPVEVDGFWIDETEVTNAQFRKFVEATGYVTTAERAPTAEEILAQSPPGTPAPPPELLVAGALVFHTTSGPVPLDDVSKWWAWTPGADWRHPEGPDSNLEGRDEHPVVQVSWDDAAAYAKWIGKRLPTEAEWEFAARGGLSKARYAWGSEPPSETKPQANLWTGNFPYQNTEADGYVRTAPVRSFAPNGYGLYDMSGNVWEWCSDWYDRTAYGMCSQKVATKNPVGPAESHDPLQPWQPQRSQRGGSFLCNDSYCSRYRPSARHGCSPDTGMSHVGFRCVRSGSASSK